MKTHITILVVMFLAVRVSADSPLNAWVTTSDNGAVQLQWKPDTSARRTYAIYRKLKSDRTFPATPIARVGVPTCDEIAQSLTQDSANAVLLRVLAEVPAGASQVQVNRGICDFISGDVHRATYRRLTYLCGLNYRLAKICGTLYEDRTARAGTTYEYEIRAVSSPNYEQVIHPGNQLIVLSGGITQFPNFERLRAYAGDGMVQLVWMSHPNQIPVITAVERDTADDNGWVNTKVREIIPIRADTSITGEPLAEGMVSYIDYGDRSPLVSGLRYKYRLRQFAANGRASLFSQGGAPLVIAPIDKTPPATVQHVNGIASNSTGIVTLTWNRSYYDVNGIKETMGRYSIYRIPNDAVTFAPNDLIATLQDPGASSTEHTMTYIDSRVVIDSCVSKFYTYLIAATDSAGNTGAQSAAIAVSVEDVIPPHRVKDFRVESGTKKINLAWQPNTDCDVERYNIYRALCDYGTWKPCPEDFDSVSARNYRQVREKSSSVQRNRGARSSTNVQQESCGGPFVLIASVDHTGDKAYILFSDETLPEDSPLCYAYVVSAQDSAGNQSVHFPMPDPIEDVVLCARMIDNSPPTPGSIARFSYDNNTITVRARTVPVQDLIGFHLYRTRDTTAQYTFLQSKILDRNSMQFVKSNKQYNAQSGSNTNLCDLIPQGALSNGMLVEFVDDSVVPYQSYWYKVTTVDRDGNESPLSKTAGVGTYTYGRADLDSCVVTVGPDGTGNKMQVRVSTAASQSSIVGYAIFRSTSKDGQFRQLGVESTTPTFIDSSVLRGVTYWYKAVVFFADQRYTDLSAPMSGTLP